MTKYLVLALIVFLSACSQNRAYHTKEPSLGNCINSSKIVKPENIKQCQESYYQEHEHFDLAFAEFSERGNAFNDIHIKTIQQRIKARAASEGMVLVTFIHGWKHNANEQDSNLIDFKKSLQTIAKSGTLEGRRLIGLYVGWRGASIETSGLNNITFWDRKAVATEIGKGGITRLFLDLEKIDAIQSKNPAKNPNVFVVIGHSFGGAIVVSALSEVLMERTIHRTNRRNYGATIGDAVIVLNPAIEANQSLHFVEAALQENFPTDQHPLFVSISTDADSATHYLFPMGQTVSLLLTWKQTDLMRSYYYDRLAGKDQPLALKEEHLDTTTIGNFAPFLTHRLSLEPDTDTYAFKTCDQVPEQCIPKGFTSLSGQPSIKNQPENYPLYFIKTGENIMSGHNDIFNPRIHAFILAIVDDVIRRNQESKTLGTGTRRASILTQPDKLQSISSKFYQTLK